MSGSYLLIRQAILERRQVRAVYKGRFRELCPHALDKLTEVSLRDGDWHSDASYGRRPQTCVDIVDVAIPVDG